MIVIIMWRVAPVEGNAVVVVSVGEVESKYRGYRKQSK